MGTRAKIAMVVGAMAVTVAALTWYSNLESQRWSVALDHNTVDFYERYREDFPEGAHVAEANRLIAELRGFAEQKRENAPRPIMRLENMRREAAQFVSTSGIRFERPKREPVSLEDLQERKTFAPDVYNAEPFPSPFVLYGDDRGDERLRGLPTEFARWHVTESLDHAATAVFVDDDGGSFLQICLIDLSNPARISVMRPGDLPQGAEGVGGAPSQSAVLESLLRQAMGAAVEEDGTR
jgi:hypothetical protein